MSSLSHTYYFHMTSTPGLFQNIPLSACPAIAATNRAAERAGTLVSCFHFTANQCKETCPQENKLDCRGLLFLFSFSTSISCRNFEFSTVWVIRRHGIAYCVRKGLLCFCFQFYTGSITKIIHLVPQSSPLYESLYGVAFKLLHLFPEK